MSKFINVIVDFRFNGLVTAYETIEVSDDFDETDNDALWNEVVNQINLLNDDSDLEFMGEEIMKVSVDEVY